MDWFPWFPVDFRRDTYTLNLAEDGAYRRLIDEYMLNRGALPDNDTALARIMGIGIDEWLTVAPRVRPYFTASGGFLVHKRCELEIRSQNNKMKRFSERGKKGAFGLHSKLKAVDARRMPLPGTLHNKTDSSFLVVAETPQEATGRKGKIEVASPQLRTVQAAKGLA